VTRMGAAASAAQGVGGFGGAGLFSDSGGKDSFSIDVRIVGAPADGAPVERTLDPTGTVQQYIQSAGQGDAILGGGAYFLEGPGDTTYSQSAVMEPLPIQDPGIYGSVIGQGDGPTGTTGVLSDPSGNDSYSAKVSIASSVAFTATDGCACDQDVNAEIGAVNSIVQGYGGNGEGVLDDGGGNDSFTIDLSSSVDLSIEDHRTGQAIPLQGSATAGKVTAYGQGLGAGIAGTGALVNAAGDDSYVFKASSTADAAGSATTAGNAPATTSYPADVVLDGQGTGTLNGLGALIDLGGSDTYRASASSSGSTGAGDPVSGVLKLHAQGAVDASPSFGVLVDLDGTGTDTFASTPAVAACQGVRGQGTWQDCGQYGGGANA
jgi:hypothetical protein